jgi:hypothetical protein
MVCEHMCSGILERCCYECVYVCMYVDCHHTLSTLDQRPLHWVASPLKAHCRFFKQLNRLLQVVCALAAGSAGISSSKRAFKQRTTHTVRGVVESCKSGFANSDCLCMCMYVEVYVYVYVYVHM